MFGIPHPAGGNSGLGGKSMNEKIKTMRSPDALRKILEVRQKREIRQICEDVKASVNTGDLARAIAEKNEAMSAFAGVARLIFSDSQAERDRRWREDPLSGLRFIVADGLRAIADWIVPRT